MTGKAETWGYGRRVVESVGRLSGWRRTPDSVAFANLSFTLKLLFVASSVVAGWLLWRLGR